MLLLLKWSTISSVSRQVSYGLYELLKTGAANIHSEADWAVTFTLLEVVGAGAPLPKLSEGTIATSTPSNGKKVQKIESYSFIIVNTFSLNQLSFLHQFFVLVY